MSIQWKKLFNLYGSLMFSVLFATIILLLYFTKTLNTISWIIFGLLFEFSNLCFIIKNKDKKIVLVIIIFQVTILKILLLWKSFYFIYEADEEYHFGYSLLLAFYPDKKPVERMIGFSNFPLMHYITAYALNIIGVSWTIILIKIFYSNVIGILTFLVANRLFKEMKVKNSYIALYILSVCYKILYFSSLFIYETFTFFLFTSLILLFTRKTKKGTSIKTQLINEVLITLCLIIFGMWHYFSYFLSIFIFVYYLLSQTSIKSQKKEILIKFLCFLLYFLSFNISLIITKNQKNQISSYYSRVFHNFKLYQIITSKIPYYSKFLLMGIELFNIFLILSFALILSYLFKLISKKDILKYIKKKQVITVNSVLFLFSIIVYLLYSFNYIPGLNTTDNLYLLSIIAIFGEFLFIFYILMSIIIPRYKNTNELNFFIIILFIFLVFCFLIINYIITKISSYFMLNINTMSSVINELAFRLIPYLYLFGSPILVKNITIIFNKIYLCNNKQKTRNHINIIENINFVQFLKKLNFLKFDKKTVKLFLFVFIISTQSIAFIPWQTYNSKINLPEEDMLEIADWIRETLNVEDHRILLEYMYRAIAAYAYMNVIKSPDIKNIVLSLYYSRNLTAVIQLMSNNNCDLFIFDKAGEKTGYMTRIIREKYLISFYNVDKSLLQNYDDTIIYHPNLIPLYETETLILFKVNFD